MSSSPCSMATMLAWKAVGLWFSFLVTCSTGHTSRQNLWPDEKQLYPFSRHCSTKSRWSSPSWLTSGAGSSDITASPFRGRGALGAPTVDWLGAYVRLSCDVNRFSQTVGDNRTEKCHQRNRPHLGSRPDEIASPETASPWS